MLANFLFKTLYKKIKESVFFALILFSIFISSQKTTLIEKITENDGLISNYVFNVTEDHHHKLWFGTDKGLVFYENGKWNTLDIDNGMPGNYFNHILADQKKGLLLYLSEKGLYYFDTDKQKIITKYPLSSSKTMFFDMKNANIDQDYIIIKVFNSGQNKMQFLAFNRSSTSQLFPLIEKSIPKESLSEYYIKKNGGEKIIANSNIFLDTEISDANGFTYKKNKEGGLLKFRNNKLIEKITEENGLSSDFVNDIMKRKNGDIYISTIGGGISVIRTNQDKIRIPVENINAREVQYSEGKYYILSNGYIYTVEDNKILSKQFTKKDALSFLVEKNKLYVASFSGLHYYDIKPNLLELKKTFPITSGISSIFKTSNNVLFSTYGNGIIELNNFIKNNYTNPIFNNIEKMYKTPSGYALASYESGAVFLDNDKKISYNLSKKEGLLSNFVTSVFVEKDTVWIGTKKGVTAFVDKEAVLKLDKTRGFKGNKVHTIFRDNMKRLMIVTDKNLLIKSEDYLQNLGSARIIESGVAIQKALFSPEKNELLIVTKNHFSIIKINHVTANKKVITPYLQKVLIDRKNAQEKNNFILKDHNFNTMLIFKTIDNEYFFKNTLYYKLNNEVWKEFKDPRILTFNHLDQGKYTLLIKSVNEDGFEKLMPGKIEFTVQGPFYLRWWFVAITFIILGYLISRFINNQNKKKYIRKLNELRVKNQIEIEKKRISRDLHDNIGAYVTSLISKVDYLKNNRVESELDNNCDEVRADAENILTLLRQTIWVLGTKETLLVPTYDNFKNFAKKLLNNKEFPKIIFDENIKNNRKLDSTTAISLFRIMQEAFQNIIKHADATNIEVMVVSIDKIKITIKDNGKGFSTNSKEGFGIKNMKERAAEIGFTIIIISSTNGTSLEILEI